MSTAATRHATLAALRAGRLAGARRLDLRGAGLTAFPREIYALADTLEVLDLSANALVTLPDDLHRLHRLRILFGSDNAFTELPRAIGHCAQLEMVGFKANRIADVPAECFAQGNTLRWLILTDNAIAQLPESLGHCVRMRKLMLAGNRLSDLPGSLASWRALELLRISANQFDALPPWLLRMPRLAWLACAGNPFSDAHQATATASLQMQQIAWPDLELHQFLGDGASGRIHAGTWLQPNVGPTPVAVKLFKGTMTSDGLPVSEMAAACVAGEGTTPMPVLGRVVGQPAGIDGLVFPLIDPDFKPLAGPPDFDSCTRDVYPPTAGWTLRQVREIALAVAGAAHHLHRRGLMHGDLYAHNILCRVEPGRISRSILTDLGAASFKGPNETVAAGLERLDVLAFGHMLGELLARCTDAGDIDGIPASDAQRDTLDALRDLACRCVAENGAARPGFAQLQDALARQPS